METAESEYVMNTEGLVQAPLTAFKGDLNSD